MNQDLSVFWGAVAQVGPVFALALVLEARQLAGRWRAPERLTRVVQGVAFTVSAIALWAIETTALAALATGSTLTWGVAPTVVGLSAVIAGMCLAPVASVASKANIDIISVVRNILPNSRWRQSQKRTTRMIKNLEEYLGVTDALIALQEEQIPLTKQLRKSFKKDAEISEQVVLTYEMLVALIDREPQPHEARGDGTFAVGIAEVRNHLRVDLNANKSSLQRNRRNRSTAAAFLGRLNGLKSYNQFWRIAPTEAIAIDRALAPYRNAPAREEAKEAFVVWVKELESLQKSVDQAMQEFHASL